MKLYDFVEPTNARELSQSLSSFCIKNGAQGKEVKVSVSDKGQIVLTWEKPSDKSSQGNRDLVA